MPGGDEEGDEKKPKPILAVILVAVGASALMYASSRGGKSPLTRDLGGPTASMSTSTSTSASAAAPNADSALALALGPSRTCVLRADHRLACAGLAIDATSALGHDELGPMIVAELPSSTKGIAVGLRHVCALAGGQVMCAGTNEVGQLGDGTTTGHAAFAAATGLDAPLAFSSSASKVCVVAGGAHVVRCFGDLGVKDAVPDVKTSPFELAGLGAVTQVSTSDHHACARRDDGTVVCWGAGGDGQLGDGAAEDRVAPVLVEGLAAVAEVAAGKHHSCARLTSGRVACFGENAAGEVGDGTTERRPRAVTLEGLADVTQIAAGAFVSCAVRKDGALFCWGKKLGVNFLDRVTTPTRLAAPPDVVEVALGAEHACVRDRKGQVQCWGWNDHGQLGDGTTTPRTSLAPMGPAAPKPL